ncbi:MAG: hypothetical protein MJ105_09575, partial [Lachnospiraceae bacterium]|nr:hypothetical protein [Lachnospiraceae bacterium]
KLGSDIDKMKHYSKVKLFKIKLKNRKRGHSTGSIKVGKKSGIHNNKRKWHQHCIWNYREEANKTSSFF